jgi:septal ring-binding cell division protein DamX
MWKYIGGILLNKRSIILILLLVSLFTGLSLGQNDNNTSITKTGSTNESLQSNDTADVNASQAAAGPNLNYIWSFTGIEIDPITMVLNQEGSELYGQAKYEPEGGKAWNADVLGSISGNEVKLTLTAQKDRELVTTKMTGIYADDTIVGNFTQISGGKKIGSGSFSALWVSPEVSSYSPAIIEEPKVETPAAVEDTTATNTTAEQTAEPAKPASRFIDVRQYKDKIGPGGDLSGIPPGMSGR